MTEVQKYEVVKSYKDFEVRDYAPFITVSTLEAGNMLSAGNQAFRTLASFIFGGNRESKKIPMTAPITEVPVDNGYKVSFVMPSGMSIADMPTSEDANLKIAEHSAMKMAAIRFSGTVGNHSFSNNEKKLKELLLAEGIEFDPTPMYARYNAPTTPFFLRRNEVLLSLKT
jgi:effector-binding domain-containing protein